MILTGYALRVEQDLTPAAILAPAHATAGDPALLAAHCLETVDPRLAEQAREGDILAVRGRLAGGAGAEAAVLALQALGIAAVICAEADPALRDLAGGYGLPLLAQPAAAAAIAPGAIVRIDLERGSVAERETGAVWECAPCPPEVVAAARRAQLLARMRRVVEDEGFAE